jgi:polysaccharide export outer membrane protein
MLVALLLCSLGCSHTVHLAEADIRHSSLPRELDKQTLTDYVIEPPDILLIDAISIIPKPPYRVAPGDVLLIQVPDAFKTEPISGPFSVEPDGSINLGLAYGSVQVAGKTIPEAQAAIVKQLDEGPAALKNPKALVALAQSRAMQQIRGQHLVTPDGSVRLGLYGSVRIAGMTVNQARAEIEAHLRRYLQDPEISLDVAAYNSKIYYVIFDGGGAGQQIVRLPVTGNDTVLDAIAQAGGLTAVSSTDQIWVARPAPADSPCDQVMPVDWCGITTRGRTATNYQLMPGDRIYVKANPLITLDTALARAISPIERLFGIVLLGTTTVQAIKVTEALPGATGAANTGNSNNGITTGVIVTGGR